MEDAPALVLVPPTPLALTSPATQTSGPVPRSTSFPAQPSRYSSVQNRPTSQTTIFSIYSKYGGDEMQQGRFSTSSYDRRSYASNDTGSNSMPTVKLNLPEHRRMVSKQSISQISTTELAYLDSHEASSESMRQPRPPSSHAASSSIRASKSEDNRTSRHSTKTSLTSSLPDPYSSSPHSKLVHSRNTSLHSKHSNPHSRQSSQSSLRHGYTLEPADLSSLPPLPPSRNSSLMRPLNTSSPPRQHSVANTSQSSNPLPLKHPIFTGNSKTSLVPSDGEDMDAFHVRNTYAQLEMTGVRGDGYEEGVERTRAKIGPSRASQLDAEAAIADGTEKSRELNPKEIQVLQDVDRYGFFSLPSHDRLVLLNSAPLQKRLSPVTSGPPSAQPNATPLNALPPARKPPKELARMKKWTRMMQPMQRDQGANVQSWTVKPGKEGKLQTRVYKGIPESWRAGAWDLLFTRFAKSSARETERLGAEYRDRLDKPSTYDIQIDLDVPRTITGHIMFRTRYGAGQRSLFHVLHSFSLKCQTCGYVQGMGPIAATLLCYFEPERVYASLVRLHDNYNLHTVFSPGFPGLLEAIYVQERIMQQMMPDVYAAFSKHSISTTSYATKWYITLFSNSVPFQTQLRLWDAFLLEGYDLFIAVAVAIVWVYRDQITSSSANFETVLSLLSSFFVPEDEDQLLHWIEQMLEDKKLRGNMQRWKADWRDLVATGKDATALL